MLDNGGMFGEIAENMGFDPVFVLLPPTHRALPGGTTLSPLLDRVLADSVGDHFGTLVIGSGKIDFVAEIEQENLRFLPTTHGGMYDVGDCVELIVVARAPRILSMTL
jgi:hypothetical protein